MKRAIQTLAIVLIGLLPAGPAWAALSCTLGNSAMAASCPMGMSQMDANCPMAHTMTMDCSQECCNRTLPQAIVIPGIPVNSKIAASAPAMFSLPALQTAGTSATPESVSLAVAVSPPRYLLLRVFRI